MRWTPQRTLEVAYESPSTGNAFLGEPACGGGVLTSRRSARRATSTSGLASPDVSFTGFPVAALDFYDDLEIDNTKSFWEAHKAV